MLYFVAMIYFGATVYKLSFTLVVYYKFALLTILCTNCEHPFVTQNRTIILSI